MKKSIIALGVLGLFLCGCLGVEGPPYVDRDYDLENGIGVKSEPVRDSAQIAYDDSISAARTKEFQQDQVIIAKIKAKAAREFPEEYSLQQFTIKRETAAYYYMKTVADLKIRKKVQREFPMEFSLQEFSYERELAAKESID